MERTGQYMVFMTKWGSGMECELLRLRHAMGSGESGSLGKKRGEERARLKESHTSARVASRRVQLLALTSSRDRTLFRPVAINPSTLGLRPYLLPLTY